MIVSCAYCGPLPAADLESLMERAWGKHVAQHHPEWPVEMTVPEDSRWSDQFDGEDGEECQLCTPGRAACEAHQ